MRTSCSIWTSKPSNIYMRNDYTPVLIDFGAARQTLATDTPMLADVHAWL